MEIAHTVKLDGFRYEVVYDYESTQRLFYNCDMDFESKADKEAYLNKFRTGDLAHYGVRKLEMCAQCDEWHEIDAVWGFDAQNPKSALKYYLENFNQGE